MLTKPQEESIAMGDIFFSHVEEDRALVVEIADGLERAGYTTWYYERDSLPGIPFVRQLPGVIDSAQAVVIVISGDALGSPHVDREIVEAYRGGKPLIPLLLGLTHSEFRGQRRDWALMLGAAVFVTVPTANVSDITPRITAGLRQMNVRPSGTPAAARESPPTVSPVQRAPRADPVPAVASAPPPETRGGPDASPTASRAPHRPPSPPGRIWMDPEGNSATRPSPLDRAEQTVRQPAGTRSTRRQFVRTVIPIALFGGAGYGYWRFGRSNDSTIKGITETASFPHEGPVFALAVHPTEPLIATGGDDKKIRLWNRDDPDEDSEILADDDQIRSATFSSDGTTLATGTISSRSAQLWDVETRQLAASALQHPMQVYSVAMDHDRTLLATACQDTYARLFDLQRQNVLLAELFHDAPVLAVAFHPGQPLMATGSGSGEVRLYDLTQINTPPVIHSHRADADVLVVAFSPGGSTLASGSADATVQLWNLDQADDVRTLDHDDTVRAIAFHPTKPLLATGGSDGILRLWDMEPGADPALLVKQVSGHAARIRAAAFLPDGSRLLTAGDDKLVRAWALETA